MSRKGTKTIGLPEEFHEKVKDIADRNGLEINETVMVLFKQHFPKDFEPPKITLI